MRRSVILIALVSCSGRTPAKPDAAAARPAPAASDAGPPAEVKPPPSDAQKKAKIREPAVFVDGVPYGVMSFGELPPKLATRWETSEEGRTLRRFELYAYLEALGVPMARAKDIHIHGPRRIATLKIADLRRWRKYILFSFTQSSTGKPRIHWLDNQPIPGRTTIDLVRAIAVYVDKPAPVRNPELMRLEIDGEPIEDGVAYQSGDVRSSVRIYRDGRLIGSIKRRELGERFLIPGSDVAGDPRWTLVPFVESLGQGWSDVRTVDLIYDDALVKRIPAKELVGADFSAQPDKKAEVRIRPMDIKVGAILLYVRSKPPGPR